MMKNSEAIKIIKNEKSWKASIINILNISKIFYQNGGYYIDIVKFTYKNKNYQLNSDINDNIIFEVN